MPMDHDGSKWPSHISDFWPASHPVNVCVLTCITWWWTTHVHRVGGLVHPSEIYVDIAPSYPINKTRVVTHLLSGMNHQVTLRLNLNQTISPVVFSRSAKPSRLMQQFEACLWTGSRKYLSQYPKKSQSLVAGLKPRLGPGELPQLSLFGNKSLYVLFICSVFPKYTWDFIESSPFTSPMYL